MSRSVARFAAWAENPVRATDFVLLALLSPVLILLWMVQAIRRDWAELRAEMRRDAENDRARNLLRLLQMGRGAQTAWARYVALCGTHPDALVTSRFRRQFFRDLKLRLADDRWESWLSVPAALISFGLPPVMLAPIDMDLASRAMSLVVVYIGSLAIAYLLFRAIRRRLFVPAVAAIVAVIGGASALLAVHWQVYWPGPPGGQRLPDTIAGVVMLCGSAAATVLGILVLTVPIQAVEWLRHARQVRRHPDIFAFRALTSIAVHLGQPDHVFATLASRRLVIRDLERLARAVELGYPRAIVLPAAADRDSFTDKCANLARAIRAHQAAVAFPDVGTRPALHRMVATTTTAVCTGRLGSLVQGPLTLGLSTAARPRRRPGRAVLAACRALLTAALPLTAAKVLEWRGYLDDKTNSAVLAVCALWAVVYLMPTLDPLFDSRVGTIGKLLEMVRGKITSDK